jgi:hypothetical protein
MKRSILDAASVVRSKNAGPYELTLDILFKHRRHADLFRTRNVLTRRRIAELYGVSPEDVSSIVYFEPANAVKITLKRRVVSGSAGETDVYGAQQHAPLLTIEFEE